LDNIILNQLDVIKNIYYTDIFIDRKEIYKCNSN